MKTKIAIASLGAMIVFGCAHTRIAGWSENEVKVCGNQWAQDKDFDAAAAKRCPAGFKAIGGMEQETGKSTVTKTNSFGGPGAAIETEKENCVLYRCGK
jgi:hypothetical protein